MQFVESSFIIACRVLGTIYGSDGGHSEVATQ
jgi:hypothetical protein